MEDRRMHKARDFDAHASFIRFFVIFKERILIERCQIDYLECDQQACL